MKYEMRKRRLSVASLSPEYMFSGTMKNKTVEKENERALHVALFSVISGSIHPLLMVDTREAKKRPVMFTGPANS